MDLATANVAFANNILYYMGSMLTTPTLTTIPFTAITASQPTVGVKSFSAQGASGCIPTGASGAGAAFGTNYYYQCAVRKPSFSPR